MTQTDPRQGDETDRSTAETARLFDVAARENGTIRLLAGCRARLHQVRQAQSALMVLTASDLKAALKFRRQGLGGEPA